MNTEPAAPAHPSAFDFDLALLGEQSPGFEQHLESCLQCRGQLEGLQRDQQAFAASPAPEQAARQVADKLAEQRRARWRWWWPAPAALVAVAAVLALVLVRPEPLDGVRTKGTVQVEAFVKSGDAAARRLAPSERLEKGDRVQLGYQAAGFTHLTLFVLERGCEAVLAGAWPLEQPEGVLPSSWALSGEGGGRLYLAFSHAPVSGEAFVAALRAAPRGCEGDATPGLETDGFLARGVAVLPAAP